VQLGLAPLKVLPNRAAPIALFAFLDYWALSASAKRQRHGDDEPANVHHEYFVFATVAPCSLD
jgi:hypothetical protein